LNYNFTDFDESIEKCFKKYKHPKINFENKDLFFILLDLDGTIIDSDNAHYNAYKKTFEKYNIDFLDRNAWKNMITNSNIDIYLRSIFDEETFKIVKREKQEYLKDEKIQFTKNSDKFICFLIENDFNFCVVTNTGTETVRIFKEKLPLLDKINQWVYREDCILPKPDGECYELAKHKYYKNEPFIIGFEDSMVGYHALKHHTDLIYMYDNEEIFKNNDCFLIDDYNKIFTL